MVIVLNLQSVLVEYGAILSFEFASGQFTEIMELIFFTHTSYNGYFISMKHSWLVTFGSNSYSTTLHLF